MLSSFAFNLNFRRYSEEGGTQDIVGSIRAGLAFQIKSAVGQSVIAAAEESLGTRIYGGGLHSPTSHLHLGPFWSVSRFVSSL
jgi:selenocysteine lyase/cysteine desulfurase